MLVEIMLLSWLNDLVARLCTELSTILSSFSELLLCLMQPDFLE